MSQETLAWLNTEVLIGQTTNTHQTARNKDGKAWHFRPELQVGKGNHYEGFIPLEDVRAHFDRWHIVVGELTATALTPDGVLTSAVPRLQALMRSDTGAVLGTPTTSYGIHPFTETIVDKLANVVDDERLGVVSAGFLKGGAQGWMQVESPEICTGPGGFEYRPYLTAYSSYDSSRPTDFISGADAVVCDNTLGIAANRAQRRLRVKHTRHSLERVHLTDIREALGLVNGIASDLDEELEALLSEQVSNDRFGKWADLFSGAAAAQALPDGRGKTLAFNKRDALWDLWQKDERVTPWKNTALGVVQAGNTWTHWLQTVKGVSRDERNMDRRLSGDFTKVDEQILATLAAV